MRGTCLLLSGLLLSWTSIASAGEVFYSSLPKQLPGNIASVGAEAAAFREVGDGIVFAPGTGGTIEKVTVALSSWGCKTGRWYTGDCSTPSNAKFSQAVTLNIYSVVMLGGVPSQGSLLGTMTDTFQIPYRPSSDPAKCGGNNQVWYSEKDKSCYHGLAVTVDFDLKKQNIAMPDQVIIGVSYNSTHYGPAPIGEATPCFTSSGGCPYDSLNVGSDGPGGTVGSVIDPNGIFVNYVFPSSYCQPHLYTGSNMQLDNSAGCWTGFHPQIEITAQNRTRIRPPKNAPIN